LLNILIDTETLRERISGLFDGAVEQVCFDLEVDPLSKRIKKEDDFPEGHGYFTASGYGKLGEFRFTVDLNEKSKNIPERELKAGLSIHYAVGASSYSLHEDILWLEHHGDFLGRWAAWAVHNFNLQHNRLNLQSRFQESSIRIYGLPRYSQPTISEMKLLLAGIEKYQYELLVYRFRHVSQDVRYRSFSYAFLVSNDYDTYWVFFPSLGGLDSGGAGGDFKETEEQIEILGKKLSLERKYFDITYDELEAYLRDHSEGFEGTLPDAGERYTLVSLNGEFGDDFMESYSKFEHRSEEKAYPHALRDLRVLVQRALKQVCNKKHVKISDIKDQSINNLAGRLIRRTGLTAQQSAWFTAFSSVANFSAHDDYPTKKDMQEYHIRHRVMITFVLGTHLLSELEHLLPKKKRKRG
jgi:hypothetical protein